jgi:translation initiation factor eIF-2B subunit epsilon
VRISHRAFHDTTLDAERPTTCADQSFLSQSLGPDSDAFVWPRRFAPEGDEDGDDKLESFNNMRLMRLGMFPSVC